MILRLIYVLNLMIAVVLKRSYEEQIEEYFCLAEFSTACLPDACSRKLVTAMALILSQKVCDLMNNKFVF